jgi:hypothetical protein
MKREKIMCVYCLWLNGKKYIGSTIDYKGRMCSHIGKLRDGIHGNKHFQRAFDKYGENKLIFGIIEYITDETILRNRENYWINYYNTTNNEIGFNMGGVTDIGGVRYKWTEEQKANNRTIQEKAFAKEYFFYNPLGELIKIYNLKKFCKLNNLEYHSMISVLLDRSPEHKGWKKNLERKNKCYKELILINPEGVEIKITNLKKFCRENKLTYQNMWEMCKGKFEHYKKWRLKDGAEITNKSKSFRKYCFKDPDGKIYNLIGNLKDFCITNKLSSSSMSEVNSGKRYSCNGWTNPNIKRNN